MSWNTLLFKAVRTSVLMNALTIQYPVRASALYLVPHACALLHCHSCRVGLVVVVVDVSWS